MNTSEFVQATMLKAKGKATALAATDKKYEKIVAIGNDKIRTWERMADWNSLYDPEYEIGTITASNTFKLPDEIRKISDSPEDYVRIVRLDDTYSEWVVVNPDQLNALGEGNFCAKIGRNLVFSREFTSTDDDFGGTITVPCYLFASTLVGASSEVPVDDPNWLVYISAAEYVRTDIANQNQYPNLVAESNELLDLMMEENDAHFQMVSRPWSLEV